MSQCPNPQNRAKAVQVLKCSLSHISVGKSLDIAYVLTSFILNVATTYCHKTNFHAPLQKLDLCKDTSLCSNVCVR